MSIELIKKIEALKSKERTLREEIEKYLVSHEKAQSVNLSGLSLRHTVYDRRVSWLSIEDGRAKFWNSKGYYNSINDLPLDDIISVLEYVERIKEQQAA
jgi:hypothetical protein